MRLEISLPRFTATLEGCRKPRPGARALGRTTFSKVSGPGIELLAVKCPGPGPGAPGPGAELLAVKWGVSKNTWSLIFVGRSFLTFSPVKTQAFAADATRRQEPGAASCSQARANTRVKRKGLSDDAEPSAKVQSHRRRVSGRSFDSLNVVGSVGEPRAAQPNAKSRQSVAAQYVPLAPVQRQWQVENETPGLSWGLLPGSPFGPPASCPG